LKLHSDHNPGLNTVTAYGAGYIEVNQQRFEGAVAFGPEGEVESWPVQVSADITAELLLRAAGLAAAPADDPFAALGGDETEARVTPAGNTEVLLVGTGKRQHFLRPDVVRPVLMGGVGVEIMDTQAAARTYNILMAEGRRVVAVLLPA